METRDRVQFLETNLARQISWVSAADSKSSFIFTLAVAMLGLLAAVAPKDASGWTIGSAVFAALAGSLELASLLMLSFASFPRTGGPKGSLLYFGGIAKRERGQFKDAACDLGDEAYVEDLCAQCHRNAEIADTKFTWAQRALLMLYLSVVPWGLAIYLLYSK